MIDLHTHILFGFDDGAGNLDDSIEMARQAAAEGIHTVVASPHVYDIFEGPTVEKIIAKTQELNEALTDKKIDCRILPGSEVHIAADLCSRVKAGEVLTVGNGGRYLLLELPLREVPVFTEEVIYDLNLGGIRPIIAHPERNEAIMQKPALLERLIQIGALTQVSSGSLVGNFGSRVKRTAEILLDSGMLHIIASDGHSPRRRRIRMANARQIVTELSGADQARAMCEIMPRLVIEGKSVEIPELTPINWMKQFMHQFAMALPH